MSEKLVMKFDPRTIEHLGISLYSKLPTVISELVSNSWDADGDNIIINFIDENKKEIIYIDDGNGMDFDELNNKFLFIGRNRRLDGTGISPNKLRKVIGKKGLGKLSVFGIAKEIEVISIKNSVKNHFKMNIDDILSSKGGFYEPDIISKDMETDENNGTTIILREIKRKSDFDINEIGISLSKKFLIFDKINLKITHNGKNDIVVTNEMKFTGFNKQFEWNFPSDEFKFGYKNETLISGKIMTLATPIKDSEMIGIYLTSRGKIVNLASFYGLRDTDQFHTYVTGYLEVDFIDEMKEDVISTDRQSLNWENDDIKDLQDFVQKSIKKIGNDWVKKRKEIKIENIKHEKGIDIDEWQKNLPKYEKELSEKIINPILHDSNMNIDKSTDIITNVIDKFKNEDFKRCASDITDIVTPSEIPKFITLMNEWQIIEAKQFSSLAITRIEVIKKFEEYIISDTKEVPTLHNFLKKFSWLLDPRILEFKDEVTYTDILKIHFPDDKLEEKDRRIDFLCSNALGNILYVVEIKRSKYKIDNKAIEQAYEYGIFLKDKYSSQSGFSQVICYIIGGEKSSDSIFKAKENTYMKSGEVFVKTYKELLAQAKEYHKEFIDKYIELKK